MNDQVNTERLDKTIGPAFKELNVRKIIARRGRVFDEICKELKFSNNQRSKLST